MPSSRFSEFPKFPMLGRSSSTVSKGLERWQARKPFGAVSDGWGHTVSATCASPVEYRKPYRPLSGQKSSQKSKAREASTMKSQIQTLATHCASKATQSLSLHAIHTSIVQKVIERFGNFQCEISKDAMISDPLFDTYR